MKLYHVLVEQEDQWLVGRVLERDGITTQGRSMDELLFMVRDAIELMWGERQVELELFVSGKIVTPFERRKNLPKSSARPGKKAVAGLRGTKVRAT